MGHTRDSHSPARHTHFTDQDTKSGCGAGAALSKVERHLVHRHLAGPPDTGQGWV